LLNFIQADQISSVEIGEKCRDQNHTGLKLIPKQFFLTSVFICIREKISTATKQMFSATKQICISQSVGNPVKFQGLLLLPFSCQSAQK